MKTVYSLSGGGAKGSFQLGALECLYSLGVNPNAIVGTSVGSVNGVKLAEGETGGAPGYRGGLNGLSQIWRQELFRDEDMYLKTYYFQELTKKTGNLYDNMKCVGIGTFFTGYLPLLSLSIAEILDIKIYLENTMASESLYLLKPIEDRFRGTGGPASLNLDQLRQSDIEVYLTSVGLSTGNTYYVSKFGEIFVLRNGELWQTGSNQDLLDAILASAAIPLAFEPRRVAGEYAVDGGVLETIPFAAATALSPSRLIAVGCGAPTRAWAWENWEEDPQDWQGVDVDHLPGDPPMRLLKIGQRGLDLALNEIALNDIATASSLACHTWVIRPEIEVHDTMTIETGLIHICADYGWMSAHDHVSSSIRSSGRRRAMLELARQITVARRRAWQHELMIIWDEDFWSNSPDPTLPKLKQRPDPSDPLGLRKLPPSEEDYRDVRNRFRQAMLSRPLIAERYAKIHELKQRVYQLLRQRIQLGGVESLPESSHYCWKRYERHTPSGLSNYQIEIAADGCRYPTSPLNLPQPTDYESIDPKLRLEWVGRSSGWVLQSNYGNTIGLVDAFVSALTPNGNTVTHIFRGKDNAQWAARETVWSASANPRTLGPSIQGFCALASNFDDPSRFQLFAQLQPAVITRKAQLYHYEDNGNGSWSAKGPVKVDGKAVEGVAGTPEAIQGLRGKRGHYELVVPLVENGHSKLAHFVGDNDNATVWRRENDAFSSESPINFTSTVYPEKFCLCVSDEGNLEIAIRIVSRLPETPARLSHKVLQNSTGKWEIATKSTGITGIVGRPAMIHSVYGMHRYRELVAVIADANGQRVEHFRCAVETGEWKRLSTVFDLTPSNSMNPGSMTDCWLIQSSFGVPGDLILLVRRKPAFVTTPDTLLQFTFDGHSQSWSKSSPVSVSGESIRLW